MIRVRNVGFFNCYVGYVPFSPTGELGCAIPPIRLSDMGVIALFFVAQDSRVTSKKIFADGIKTTATILTGPWLVGWTTPSGSVGLFKRGKKIECRKYNIY